MKNLSWPQLVVLLACVAAPIVAYKLLGSAEAAAASMVVGMVLNFLMGRSGPSDPPPPSSGEGGPPVLKSITGGLAKFGLSLAFGAALASCYVEAKTPAERAREQCQIQARADVQTGMSADEAWLKYLECKRAAGL
jgi:hypothetical protein